MSWVKENCLSFFQLFCIKVVKTGRVPQHVAFIMDGNRRYAKKHNVKSGVGHYKGFDKLSETLKVWETFIFTNSLPISPPPHWGAWICLVLGHSYSFIPSIMSVVIIFWCGVSMFSSGVAQIPRYRYISMENLQLYHRQIQAEYWVSFCVLFFHSTCLSYCTWTRGKLDSSYYLRIS